MFRKLAMTAGLFVLAFGLQPSQAHEPPNEARVFIIEPANGAVVTSPVLVKMGIEGFGITPAETKGKRRHTAGHHHVLLRKRSFDETPELGIGTQSVTP